MQNQVQPLKNWLDSGFHGDMDYMARHVEQRLNPGLLVPNAARALMVSMPYRPNDEDWQQQAWDNLEQSERAYVARYALGRDYHKVVRQRLQKLMTRLENCVGPMGYRVFADSAPIMEVELARRAGLGWRGKHTLLLSREQGSSFFLGSVLTDFPFEVTPSGTDTGHCGQCERCIEVCPTRAILAPYLLDARRCISYLTIEHKGSIDPALRPLMGNRIYGCDDCQLICPWNKFAAAPTTQEFSARHNLDQASLAELFSWTEQQFEERMAGSPIRRIGHERWLRNIAVALGNCREAPPKDVINTLATQRQHPSELVREHVDWAIRQQEARP